MGRGRAKAKQTKVARQLKYGVPTTDLERLQAELAGHSGDEVSSSVDDESDDDPYADDPYAEDPYADLIEDDDEQDSVAR
jgi:hypothetical protein